MRKVIDRHLYDTDKARKLGKWETPDGYSLDYIKETLYRTRSGQYFLHGYGGAATKYAQSLGLNSWGDGEQIIPLTEEIARIWAEQHLTPKAYEKAFRVEGDDKILLAIRATPETVEAFNARKKAEGLTAGELLAKLLR